MRIARRGASGAIETVADEERITRLGRGVDASGRLDAAAIARTLAALEEVAARARAEGAEIVAVGTSALRDAGNARELLDPAAAILGAPVEVISGAREAALTFRGACAGIDLPRGAITTIDIGGGSTEFARGTPPAAVAASVSAQIGSVRLFERHLRSDPPSPDELRALVAGVDAALDAPEVAPFLTRGGGSFATIAGHVVPPDARRIDPSAPGAIVAVAGTATTVAAIAHGVAPYDARRVHGATLRAEEISRVFLQVATATHAERMAIPGLTPGRADVIVAGAALLLRIVVRAGASEIRVSDGGVRVGLSIERLCDENTD